MNPRLQQLIMIAENSIAKVHDEMLKNYIVETLLRKGHVDIKEAQFFNELSRKILHEASDLFIPEMNEILESIELQEEAKVLVDPETGDKFVYYPDTGELVPATDEDVADVESEDEEDKDHDGIPDAEEDHGELPEGFEGDHEDAEELKREEDELDPAAKVDEDDVDVSASCSSKSKKEIKESAEELTEESKTTELNENELLVQNLMKLIKE
jgi:hypothetical protein